MTVLTGLFWDLDSFVITSPRRSLPLVDIGVFSIFQTNLELNNNMNKGSIIKTLFYLISIYPHYIKSLNLLALGVSGQVDAGKHLSLRCSLSSEIHGPSSAQPTRRQLVRQASRQRKTAELKIR